MTPSDSRGMRDSSKQRAETILKFIDTANDKYLYRAQSCLDFIAAELEAVAQEMREEVLRVENKKTIEAYETGLRRGTEEGKFYHIENCSMGTHIEDLKKARREERLKAIEECARIAQLFKWPGDNDSEVTELIAHRIRKLGEGGRE